MPACLDSTVGDGRLGYPDKAPYDAIHVGAAAAVVPEAVSWLQMGIRNLVPYFREQTPPSFSSRSRIVAVPPEVLNEIIAALD